MAVAKLMGFFGFHPRFCFPRSLETSIFLALSKFYIISKLLSYIFDVVPVSCRHRKWKCQNF